MANQEDVLQEALKTIEKKFGKGALMKLGDHTGLVNVNTFHSWAYALDLALWGGYPEGRIIEIYWPESSWKTTLTLHAIAEVQKAGWKAAFIDAEHALDPEYAKKLGVDIDELWFFQPDYGEQALEMALELAKTGTFKLIVIDSVAALVPKNEVEWNIWDSMMWLQARMMSQWMRKLTSILAKTWTSVIFINQIRMKIWVMYWNPETTTGWNALKFYASQRLEIRKWDKIEEDKEAIWNITKVKIVKNKIAPPFKTVELSIKFNQGFDKTQDFIDTGIALGLITRSWAFYSIWDQKVQWKEKLWQLLAENPEVKQKFEASVIQAIKDKKNNIIAQASQSDDWVSDISDIDDIDLDDE